MKENGRYFSGKGNTNERSVKPGDLPVIYPGELTSPENYLADVGLAAAVETALILGMPLLLTGEPGCGKSQLAYRLAWELQFPDHPTGEKDETIRNPVRLQVKSTTESRDLFYNFDTVGRFHVANMENSAPEDSAPEKFITYQGLGLAILRAKGLSGIESLEQGQAILNPAQMQEFKQEPERSIVLIDEIDKAPRDVPNDILNEVESLEFTVPELKLTTPIKLARKDNHYRPVIIITSNSERDLPEAFLRRCVYYHIGFPPFTSDKSDEVSVENIIMSRLGTRYELDSIFLRDALSLVGYLRDESNDLGKNPGIAEILNWVEYLFKLENKSRITLDKSRGLTQLSRELLTGSIKNTLLKTSDDQLRAEELISGFLDRK